MNRQNKKTFLETITVGIQGEIELHEVRMYSFIPQEQAYTKVFQKIHGKWN